VYATTEVRWFYRGPIPRAVRAWMERLPAPLTWEPQRVDHYLPLSGDAAETLGIKLREGRLEVKRRHAAHGVVTLGPGVAGILEGWHKWGVPLSAGAPPARQDAWTGVRKTRAMQRYAVAGGQVEAVGLGNMPPRGCEFEVSTVVVRERTWWSACFEAFGDEPRGEILRRVAGDVLAEPFAVPLDVAHSMSYPRWLAMLDEGNGREFSAHGGS
jgi:hypothetical protein